MIGRMLVACEFSGVVRDAFADKGWDAWSCDLLPTESIQTLYNDRHIQDDCLKYLDDGWDLMIAHPPCTYLCNRGQIWHGHHLHRDRKAKEADAIKFFMALVNAPIKYICVENPIGIMTNVYRKYDQIVQPYHYGHDESKATCLWLKRLPKLKPTNIVKPVISMVRDLTFYANKNERSKIRSITYQGIADAMADQWTRYYQY